MAKILFLLILSIANQCVAAIGIGFSERRPDGNVFLYTSEKIRESTIIRLKFGINQDAKCCQILHGRDFQKTDSVDFVMGNKEVAGYELKKRGSEKRGERKIGVAIINSSSARNYKKDVKAFKDGKQYLITTCFGTEGVNLKLYGGRDLLDSLYYYLGYDVPATCNDR
ncbi:hypothetical protein [Thauera sinica]|uniref:Secreted protein n=1 Tax=Thauera sinica TaxID=2665146 RepID=A0ABW1AKS5_9RHOO|nr:hypothetical protein [Thauera sp. K11]